MNMYALKDIYPDYNGISTIEQTIPERAEQAAYEQLDTNEIAPTPAPKAGSIWISLLVLFALLWIFNII